MGGDTFKQDRAQAHKAPILQMEKRKKELLQELENETSITFRKCLWLELIKLEDVTGVGLSKAVSHLYASWFKRVRETRDAVLEVDDNEWEIITWRGIRIDLEQLKNWVIKRIEAESAEHRLLW
jgi:hypothetical protein